MKWEESVNLISEQIISKLLSDMNRLTLIEIPPKISIMFFIKYSARFLPWFAVVNSQNFNDMEELT